MADANDVASDCLDGFALHVDLTDPAAVEAMVAGIVRSCGTLDVAFNNAGKGGAGVGGRTADYPLDSWHELMAANLHSVYHCLKYEIPVMLANGGGAIVNTASIMGAIAIGGGSCAYTASKHAVVGLTRQAAIEYAPLGVRINCIGPGYIGTPMTTPRGPAFFDTAAAYWQKETTVGGQRSWTAMAWLSEPEAGGDTNFSRLGISFPPQAGSLLMWNNALPDGTVNREVLHAGMPVLRGVKYVITKWFRVRRWS